MSELHVMCVLQREIWNNDYCRRQLVTRLDIGNTGSCPSTETHQMLEGCQGVRQEFIDCVTLVSFPVF